MDVRSGYREWAPPPALRHAVACLWVRVVPDAQSSLLVLPDACTDLIWQGGRGVFVAGPDTGPVGTVHPPGAVLVGVRFLPGAGGPALRTPLSELRNQRVALADVLPRARRTVSDSLEPDEALAGLVDLAVALVEVGPPDPLVQHVARRLADPRTQVRAVAREVALSERHLRRQCQEAVGYGPKTLQRVLRFRGFLSQADRFHQADLAGLAVAAGYADQAHLTRECNELAGTTPAQLVRSA